MSGRRLKRAVSIEEIGINWGTPRRPDNSVDHEAIERAKAESRALRPRPTPEERRRVMAELAELHRAEREAHANRARATTDKGARPRPRGKVPDARAVALYVVERLVLSGELGRELRGGTGPLTKEETETLQGALGDLRVDLVAGSLWDQLVTMVTCARAERRESEGGRSTKYMMIRALKRAAEIVERYDRTRASKVIAYLVWWVGADEELMRSAKTKTAKKKTAKKKTAKTAKKKTAPRGAKKKKKRTYLERLTRAIESRIAR